MKRYILTFVVALLALIANAQKVTVTGQVAKAKVEEDTVTVPVAETLQLSIGKH